GLGGRGRAAAERGREAAAHGHVEDHEEAVVGGVVPGRGRDLVRVDGEEVGAVEVPADLLGRDAAVVFHPVRVEPGLAAGAGPFAAADAGGLVALAARIRSTVERGELGAATVDVLQDVDLADTRPV